MSNFQHVWNPLLSQIAIDQKNREYIADQVLTPVGVPSIVGRYFQWDPGVTFTPKSDLMQQGGQPNQLDVKGTVQSYTLAPHALEMTIDPLEVSQAPMLQVETMKTIKLQNALQLNKEIAVAALLTSTGTMTSNTTLSGTGQWSDYTNSDPIAAIQAQADAMLTRPNTLILGRDVVTKLRAHPKILTAIQYTQTGGFAPIQVLGSLFGDEVGVKILIGDSFKNTANEGQTPSYSRIWGKNAILAYIDPSPPSALMDNPTLGYLPTLGGGGVPMTRVNTYIDPRRGTGVGVTIVKAETIYTPLISSPSMGYLFVNAVA